MERTISVLNRMLDDGIFLKYAIGGAMGAFFYIEPALTYDLDIFILLQPKTSYVQTLHRIRGYLHKKGYFPYREYFMIEGMPVQFIYQKNRLTEEAIHQAKTEKITPETTAWVIRAEYLTALFLRVGRAQDELKVLNLFKQGSLDRKLLNEILKKHRLEKRFREVIKK